MQLQHALSNMSLKLVHGTRLHGLSSRKQGEVDGSGFLFLSF
jgi:hypothetical protein